MKPHDKEAQKQAQTSRQIVNNPQIPGQLKDGMKNVTALVNNLQGDLNKELKSLPGNLQDLGKNLPDAGKGLQNMGNNLQNLGKNLPNPFNNNQQNK